MKILSFDDSTKQYIVRMSKEEVRHLISDPSGGSHHRPGHSEDIAKLARDLNDLKSQQQQIKSVITKLEKIAGITD